jgi:hypothetical protein
VLEIVEERARSRVPLLGEEHCHALDPLVPRASNLDELGQRTSSLRAFSARMRGASAIKSIAVAFLEMVDELRQCLAFGFAHGPAGSAPWSRG